MKNTEIYLDHAASTPMRAEVAELMLGTMTGNYANPSSIHRAGQRARRTLETAREQVAAALGAQPRELVFTSGATEAINQALFGLASRPGFTRLLVSPLEHQAVLAVARELQRQGRHVDMLPLQDGGIGPSSLKQAELEPGDVVAAMLVNNETGALTGVRHLANMAHARGALFFCDATQAVGVEEVDVSELHVDALVLSGHKIGGPKGAGVLWQRAGLEPTPLLLGGEQERGFRAGTSNLPAMAGLGLALELATAERAQLYVHLQKLQASFEQHVTALPGVSIVAADQPRSVKHSSVQVQGVEGETLLMALDTAGVQASIGSACAAGSLEPSHVLLALGYGEAEAKATLRFSYGRDTTLDSVLEAAARLATVISQCRLAG